MEQAQIAVGAAPCRHTTTENMDRLSAGDAELLAASRIGLTAKR